MPERRPIPKGKKRGVKAKREWEFVTKPHEQAILKRVGRQIHEELINKGKSVEWLSYETNTARSALHEIIAGRSNPKLLTLNAIAEAFGYGDVMDFLGTAKNKK